MTLHDTNKAPVRVSPVLHRVPPRELYHFRSHIFQSLSHAWVTKTLNIPNERCCAACHDNQGYNAFPALDLQKAGEWVERAQQTSEEQRNALNEFMNILVKREVLAHKDKVDCAGSLTPNAFTGTRLPTAQEAMLTLYPAKARLEHLYAEFEAVLQDVKLRIAFCLCHVLRMHAPETPYSSSVLEVKSALAHDASQLLKRFPASSHAVLELPHTSGCLSGCVWCPRRHNTTLT